MTGFADVDEKLPRICVLYTRMASYFWDCLCFAADHYPLRFEVVARRASSDAPLEFPQHPKIRLRQREETTDKDLRQLCAAETTRAILVTGWTDKGYLSAVRGLHIPRVCMVDNPYRGNFRQLAAATLAFKLFRPYFSHAWVTGRSSYSLMRRFGFPSTRILSGLYVADPQRFIPSCNDKSHEQLELLFVGRLLDWKGALDLTRAFLDTKDCGSRPWRLRIVGRGPLKQAIAAYESDEVIVQDFVAPQDISKLFSAADAFCLPSWDEHWGVVVQEAALTGLPLICSHKVRSAERFLIDQYNGWSFPVGDEQALRGTLVQMRETPPHLLSEMGANSRKLALTLTPETWAAKLMSLIDVAAELPQARGQKVDSCFR